MIWQPIRNGVRVDTWSFRFRDRGQLITRGGYPTRKHALAGLKLAREALADDDLRTLEAMRRRRRQTVGEMLAAYAAAGCPNKSGHVRSGDSLETERWNLGKLSEWWGSISSAQITEQHRLDYWAHRQQTVRRGLGHRATELELTTLNNAIAWAWRRGDLKELPRSMRATFRATADVSHARDHMPACGDELHALARALFHVEPVCGWAFLLSAITGLRRCELLWLEANPERSGIGYRPGFMDESYLRIKRAKRGRNPRITLTDPQRPYIRPLLQMIKDWHAATCPAETQLLPVNEHSLSKAVTAAAENLKLPRRTLHAARAYYASVRLAQGLTHDAVAQELGQRSGADLVRDVYGANPDDFDAVQWTSLSDRLTWLPNTPGVAPAWSWWTERPQNIIAL